MAAGATSTYQSLRLSTVCSGWGQSKYPMVKANKRSSRQERGPHAHEDYEDLCLVRTSVFVRTSLPHRLPSSTLRGPSAAPLHQTEGAGVLIATPSPSLSYSSNLPPCPLESSQLHSPNIGAVEGQNLMSCTKCRYYQQLLILCGVDVHEAFLHTFSIS